MAIKTDYKDDIFSGNRKYQQVDNSDGTVSFTDMTDYTQEGDTISAVDINAITAAVIQTYTHTYADGVHNLIGSGNNGRFEVTAAFTSGDTWAINGTAVTAYQGTDVFDGELRVGGVMPFWVNGDELNFSGASGLKLKVVGGETQPENPSSGIIWVKTDTDIGDYQLCGDIPTTRSNGSALQDGDVWLPITGTDGATVRLDSSGIVVVALHDARQYNTDTGWDKRSAYTYTDNEWVTISYVLFYNGYQDATFDQEMPAVFAVSAAKTTNYAYLNSGTFDVAGLKNILIECSNVYVNIYNSVEMKLTAELLSSADEVLVSTSKTITSTVASTETFTLAIPEDTVGTVKIKVTLLVRVWQGAGDSRTGHATISSVSADSV